MVGLRPSGRSSALLPLGVSYADDGQPLNRYENRCPISDSLPPLVGRLTVTDSAAMDQKRFCRAGKGCGGRGLEAECAFGAGFPDDRHVINDLC